MNQALAAAEPVLPPYVGIALVDVSLVRTAADVERARGSLLAADALGFDTESKPTFRKGEVSSGPHLIQLATDQRVYLFPVGAAAAAATTAIASHALLAELLGSARILKAGFGLRDDVKRLKLKLGIDTAHVLDLAVALRTERRKDVGAKSAVAALFGQRLQKSKSISTSNWATPQLSERQMLYAADDAQVALRIYRKWAQSRTVVPPNPESHP